jgi:aspartate/methionine/tyrosine aminotransferase
MDGNAPALPAHEIRNRHFDALTREEGLLWLGQNTNHLPPHPAVLQAMHAAVDGALFNAYAPPLGIERLRELILQDLGLDPAVFGVIVTDGAVAGLSHAVRSLLRPGDALLAAEPGWKWPLVYAREIGATAVELPVYDAAQGYRLSPAQLRAAVTPATRLIYLVDPNNPMGTIFTPEEIAEFATIAREADAYVIHDCTYRHFAQGHTLLAPLAPERTVTTYSFSKWLGLAGLRVGAIVASHDLIGRFAAAAPNALGSSVIAQHAAIAGLEHKAEWLPAVIAADRAAKAAIAAAVAEVPGLALPVSPSHGNFVALDVSAAGIKPEALVAAYRAKNVMIRQGGYHTARYAERFVKISTTVPEPWIARFCELLPVMVEEARGMNDVPPLF